jgi:ATP-binding cassette subfamily B protein
LLETPPEVVDPDVPVQLGTVRGEVELVDVTLSFGRGGAVLAGVNLKVASGETVAIVGPSGSGKSTIVDLIVRQLDPDEGAILLDGHDLRSLALEDLRRHVVLVEQEPYVFHTTVAENIRYGRPEAGDEAVREAARSAGLAEFIEGLPEGYDTRVGERGMTLSAGERQRLAIARAFLADPAVLVLDEATANLDPAAEERVIAGYRAVMRGRTTILITHRLDLARAADRVVVIRGGMAVETGPPEGLLAKRGVFFRIFSGEVGSRDSEVRSGG